VNRMGGRHPPPSLRAYRGEAGSVTPADRAAKLDIWRNKWYLSQHAFGICVTNPTGRVTMPTPTQDAAAKLRALIESLKSDAEYKRLPQLKMEVTARYGPAFSPGQIDQLREEDFRGFLLPENNKRWTGLYRRGYLACDDMSKLRTALALLVDESVPLAERLDKLLPKSQPPLVPNLGRALLTAILHIVYPDKYGVWNQTSQDAMKQLRIWPEFEWGMSFGERYNLVNTRMRDVSSQLGIDLWTLDWLWWKVKEHAPEGDVAVKEGPELVTHAADKAPLTFTMESYLHEFLRDNWDNTPLGAEWNLHEEDGEIVGYKYNTGEVGEIDLLAHHRSEARWLVIELKREHGTDKAVGQVLRYMGWVKEKLAEADDHVGGLIIAREDDAKLKYALKCTSGIAFQVYKVRFELEDA